MDRGLRVYTKKRLKGRSGFDDLLRRFTVTNWFIIINIAVFVLALLAMGIYGQEKVFSWIGLQPSAFFSGTVWTLLTSMFMHGGFAHLFVNMFSLFFIGTFIERLIGRKRFFWLI